MLAALLLTDGARSEFDRSGSSSKSKPKSPSLTTIERLVAGGTARAASQCLLYPADALRTLAQTRAGAKTLGELGMSTLVSGCATTSAFAYLMGATQHAIYGSLASTMGPLLSLIHI